MVCETWFWISIYHICVTHPADVISVRVTSRFERLLGVCSWQWWRMRFPNTLLSWCSSKSPPPPPPPPSSYAPTYRVQFVAHGLGIWFSSNATSEFPILPWPIPMFCSNSQQILFVNCNSLIAIQFASPTKVFFVRIDCDVIVWRNTLAFHWTLTLKRSPKSRWLSFLRFFVAISCVFILFFFAICSHLIWSSHVFHTSPSAHFQPHQSSFYRPHKLVSWGAIFLPFLLLFMIHCDY